MSEYQVGDPVQFTGGYFDWSLRGQRGVVERVESSEDGDEVHVRIIIDTVVFASPEKLRPFRENHDD